MTHTEAEKLLAELAAEYETEPYDPERDVTKDMLAERLHIQPGYAYDILQKAVRAGTVTRRFVRVDGRRITVFRRV